MSEELTNRIVKDVLAALGKGPAGGAAPTPGATSRRDVGNATNRSAVAVPVAAGAHARTTAGDSAPRTTKVFVTAQMLRQRLNGAEGSHRAVELAWNEVLTPNARDFVQQMRLDVKRNAKPGAEPAPAAIGAASAPPAAPRSESNAKPLAASQVNAPHSASSGAQTSSQPQPGRSIGLVVSRPDGKVTAVLASLQREGIALVPFAGTDCPIRNLTALCEAIGAGQVSRGVVIAPHAAGAMVLAGKCKGVRPVQATRAASVEAGLRQFAANLLVVEHTFSTLHEIRAMVRLFAAGPKAPPADQALMAAMGRLGGA